MNKILFTIIKCCLFTTLFLSIFTLCISDAVDIKTAGFISILTIVLVIYMIYIYKYKPTKKTAAQESLEKASQSGDDTPDMSIW